MYRAVAVALVLLATLAVPAGAAERRVPQGWLGVTVDGPVDPRQTGEWRRMARAGVETVRVAFRWSELQPTPGAPPAFGASDAFVAAAARQGMAVLPVVEGVPPWVAVRPHDPLSPPRDEAAVAAFFGALVGRYGPSGSFWAERRELPRLPIRAWQVWNEPNHADFWTEQPYAPSYVATLRGAATGIRAADPSATIVLAGLTNRSWVALRELYAAGARGLFDAVAVHPFTAEPRNVLRLVRLARREMRAAGDGRLPIWITELSWPAAKGKVKGTLKFRLTDADQARLLGEVLPLLARARQRQRIARVLWYTWLSSERGPSEFDWSGLRRVRRGRVVSTPALAAFRRAARRLEGCRKARADARRCA
jgi:polysaccharide biosynthesis protein PslG